MEEWTSVTQKRTRDFPLEAGENMCFQSNGHSSLFLVPLDPFSGMCNSNFLSAVYGNFRTFLTTFILSI